MHTYSGDRINFANRYELKDGFGVLFVLIDLRVENVFGYTLDDLNLVFVNAVTNTLEVRVGAPFPEDIFLESWPGRYRHLGTRPDIYKVDMSICHSGHSTVPYRVMRDIFDRMIESGIKSKVGVYDNKSQIQPGVVPTHFSLFMAARLGYSTRRLYDQPAVGRRC